MDRKTLEYMEKRTKKARNLIVRIDGLTKNAEKMKHIDTAEFRTKNTHGNYVCFEGYDLIRDIKKHTLEAITREIARLEQELAEL